MSSDKTLKLAKEWQAVIDLLKPYGVPVKVMSQVYELGQKSGRRADGYRELYG